MLLSKGQCATSIGLMIMLIYVPNSVQQNYSITDAKMHYESILRQTRLQVTIGTLIEHVHVCEVLLICTVRMHMYLKHLAQCK